MEVSKQSKTTRGGYVVVAGPIPRPMNCWQYVVLNDDGHYDQLHVCKCFSDGRISKRGDSQYDLVESSDGE